MQQGTTPNNQERRPPGSVTIQVSVHKRCESGSTGCFFPDQLQLENESPRTDSRDKASPEIDPEEFLAQVSLIAETLMQPRQKKVKKVQFMNCKHEAAESGGSSSHGNSK